MMPLNLRSQLDTRAEPSHRLLPDVDQNGLHIGLFLGLPLLSLVATGLGPERD